MAQQTPQIAKQKKLHSISSQEQNQKIIELKKNEASNKKSDFIIEPEQNTSDAVISKPKKKLSH